ncbi:MAG TPA: TetR/AcrR family transcriptional regulator, partial [Candidatus Acidoferrum sp.]|nr:TetR/AcrR family transcriptional regulator [Candidatus Acidoferrum sp.]
RSATQKSPRWRRRKEERPAEIIAAALETFAERGFAATRLDDIAERAGVTRGTLYLYFPSKEDLFKAVVRQAIVPVIARGEAMLGQSQESSSALLAKILLMIPGVVADSPVSAMPKLMISEARNFPDLAQFYLQEVIRRGRKLVTAIIERGVERGEFRPVDMDHVFYCVVGPVLLTMLWKHSFEPYDGKRLDAQAVCRAHVDLLLHGLLKREAAP